jgi:alkylation response protein AidB-like acyl-CoA dehydrogenase
MPVTPARVTESDFSNLFSLLDDFLTGLYPQVNEYTIREEMPRSVLVDASKVGIWAPFVSHKWGALGMDWVTYCEIHRRIGRICTSLRSILTAHAMVTWAVERWARQSQKDRWLHGLVSGECIGAFCLTGRSSGTSSQVRDVFAQRTSDGGWILNGSKKWTTSGTCFDVALVYAATGKGMTAFLVPRAAPGVSVRPLREMRAARANELGEVYFKDVKLEADSVVGSVGMASMVMTTCLVIGRLTVASGSVGLAETCMERTVEYTSQRDIGNGRTISDSEMVLHFLADMDVNSDAGWLLCKDAATLHQQKNPDAIIKSWKAKYFASERAFDAAQNAARLHGARGLNNRYDVSRLVGDAEGMRVIEGASELQRLIIGQRVVQRVNVNGFVEGMMV